MSSITDPEVRAFLTEGTRTGKLSFVVPSGHPLVTPVWFVLEGDTVVFNTGSDTAKGRYLARDPGSACAWTSKRRRTRSSRSRATRACRNSPTSWSAPRP